MAESGGIEEAKLVEEQPEDEDGIAEDGRAEGNEILGEDGLVKDEDHTGEEKLESDIDREEVGETGVDEHRNVNVTGESESMKGEQTPNSGSQMLDENTEQLDRTGMVEEPPTSHESESTTEPHDTVEEKVMHKSHVEDDKGGSEGQRGRSDTMATDAANKGGTDVGDSVTLDYSEQNNNKNNSMPEKPLKRSSMLGDQKPSNSLVGKVDPANRHSSLKLRRNNFKEKSAEKSTKSVSSIDINISRIIHGDGEMGGAVAMVTTKSVDFSPQTVAYDEAEQELARVVGNEDAVSIFSDLPGGRAAATNTPVESHLQHRSLHTPVRENIYQHALHLIKNRCQSRTTTLSSRYPLQYPSGVSEYIWGEDLDDGDIPNVVSLPTLLSKIDEPSFSCEPNRSFYITQHHPIPLEPLKVWKGYHGNVFFQPMICRRMRMSVSDKVPVNAVNPRARKPHTSLAMEGSRFPGLGPDAKNKRATTAKTWNGRSHFQKSDPRSIASAAAASRPVTRQMSVLDRQTVLSQMDQHFGEDITWLNGTEALGALQVGTGRSRSSAHFYDNRGQHYKLRIRRGLVSHNQGRPTREDPALDVSGGKMRDGLKSSPRNQENNNGQERSAKLSYNSSSRMHSGSHPQTLQPQNHQRSGNSKQVVVDLTTGNEIVNGYLFGSSLNVNLIDKANQKVK